MNKMLRYFLFSSLVLSVFFLASCGEEDDPIFDDSIALSSDDKTIENDEVVAAPGETFGIYVSAGTNEVTAVTDNGSIVDATGGNMATNDTIKFTVKSGAELGSSAILTFTTTGGTSEQLTVNVGYESIVDLVTFADGFSILRAALTDEVVTALNDEAPVTVFAPNDDAFRNAGYNSAADLPENVAQILTYHVVKGAVLSTDLEAGSVETLEGSNVEVTTEGGIAINEIPLVDGMFDIQTADGNVVHVIDGVLNPSFSIINSTAVLLGSQSNTTGSFYDALDNEVISYTQANANSENVDFVYYWGATNNHSIAAIDDGGAQTVFAASGVDFSGFDPQRETRFLTTDVSADEFDAIMSATQLEGAFLADQDINQTGVTALAVGDVFVVELDDARGGNLGLVKVVEVKGQGDPSGSITIDVKMMKSED